MSPLTTNDLKRIFERLDKNGDGQVSLEELSWAVERIGVQFSQTELESLVGKPGLNLDEFLFFCESISKHNNINYEDEDKDEDEVEIIISDLVKAFKVFDQNGDGFISCEELQSVLMRLGLMEENSDRDCKTMINAFDANSDGKLDFEEFKSMMLLTSTS